MTWRGKSGITTLTGKVFVKLNGEPALIDEVEYAVFLRKGEIRPVAESVPKATAENSRVVSEDSPTEDAESPSCGDNVA